MLFRRALAGVRGRLGRRGAILLAFGAIYLVYGYALLTAPPRLGTLLYIDYHWWAWLWIGGGGLGILHSWARKPGRDTAGFVAIVAPPLVWTVGYIHLWIFGPDPGAQAWKAVGIWAALAIATMVCAGWPEPEVRT